ncbi:response regulator [Nocardia sp. NPDC127579]|uniref:response regulator n=1 Tax=Nocardia sp. NPDC127579 TaxID=3345402 RepID=UPI00363FC8EC
MAGPRISIVVIDDHTLLRAALCEMIALETDLAVVAEVGDGASGVGMAARLRPDVVVLDVEMPGESVRDNIGRLRAASPRSRILIVTMHQDMRLIQELAGLGIAGYLHKSASRESLLSTIRAVAAEAAGAVPVISGQRLLVAPDTRMRSCLTAREIQVLDHAADAMSNRQIGVLLGISEGTVKRHMRSVFDKLGAVSRLDAVNRAVAAKVIRARS